MLKQQSVLKEIVDRIVDAADPVRIILFGSAARNEMGPDSDLDLLIVMPDGIHRRRTSQKIYKTLNGTGVSKDIIVVTESDIQKFGDNPSLVIFPALEEGEEIYHA